MKQTRLVLALIVTSLATTPAFAASVTMLQFGSFETRDEADKKLADISSKYKDSLGTLPTSIREVKLPPDNLTVYRTQAGPVADRATAQNICNKLSGAGDECYIVQTAMVNASAPAVAAADLTKAKDQELAATTGTTPDITSKLSLMQPPVDARDPSNRAALASVNTPLADAAAAPTDQSPEMKAALDKAVADQSTVNNDINSNVAAAEPHQSFWSHLNPFSSTPKPAPAVVKTPDTAAPVESVSAAPLAAPVVVTPVTTTDEKFVAVPVAPAAANSTNAPIALAAVDATPKAGFNSAPVITTAPVMQLPPPPAPLKAQDQSLLSAGKKPLGAPESVAAPISVTPLPPGTPAGSGIVQVEEAKRVPVTSTPMVPVQQQPMAVPYVTAPFQQAPVSLQPSSTEGVKTIWAQIGPFASNDDALSYWAAYRQNHPDFPVVRVRVTSNYQALLHGVNTYTLRVGPMAQKAFVSSLCASLTQAAPGQPQPPAMQCGMVTDLGVSSALTPTPGMLPQSRYLNRR